MSPFTQHSPLERFLCVRYCGYKVPVLSRESPNSENNLEEEAGYGKEEGWGGRQGQVGRRASRCRDAGMSQLSREWQGGVREQGQIWGV